MEESILKTNFPKTKPHKKRIRNSKKILEWFFNQKKYCFCCVCGEDRVEVLEYNHIIPALKSFSIYSAILGGAKLSAVKKEIAKCNVLCNLHHKLHHKEALYESEKILYDFSVWVNYEHKLLNEIENLDFLLSRLNSDQIKFINELYGQNFPT